MDTMAEETRLPADIDAQPVVRAAAALQPMLREYHTELENASSACRRHWSSKCMRPGSTGW